MTPLEHELVELGDHLAHGDGDDLARLVRVRTEAGALGRRAVPLWVKVAAALVLAFAVALALPPSRRAIARLFGVGAVEIRTVTTTVLGPGTTAPPGSTVPGAPDGAAGSTDVDAAQGRVTFPLRVVSDAAAGPLRRIDVDERVPGGLVALVYERFTVVELASAPDAFPIVLKLAPADVIRESTKVGDAFAVWVSGAHEIAYQAPDGTIRSDTVRRAGPVLVWVRDSVTYRVEGLTDLDEARRIGATLG